MPETVTQPCRICGAPTEAVGEKTGRVRKRAYHVRRCGACGFAYVADPDTDGEIYDETYYRGGGPDPLLDYVFELDRPLESVRRFEWDGILDVVRANKPIDASTRWLDYGCGNGGLVRWVNERTPARCTGFEQGWISARAREHGIAICSADELESGAPYDVITAVEVLEHVIDPAALVRDVARWLAPGGLFFYTTGNAACHRGRLLEWSYVAPEIHVSFFEPRTMERLLAEAGLLARLLPWSRGYSEIVTFKILKNLGIRRYSPLLRALPWPLVTREADRRNGISAFPAGTKPRPGES